MQPGGDEEMRQILTEEMKLGGHYVRGYDKDGRAIIYCQVKAPKSNDIDTQTVALVHTLEKAIQCTTKKSTEIGGSPLEKYMVILNYTNYERKDRYPLSTVKVLIHQVQEYNPERLHKLYLVNTPFVFRAIWAIIKPFVDPHTVEKIVFVTGEEHLQEELTCHFADLDKVEPFVGGTGKAKPFDAVEYMNLPFDVTFDE
jgi:hypothetical protein